MYKLAMAMALASTSWCGVAQAATPENNAPVAHAGQIYTDVHAVFALHDAQIHNEATSAPLPVDDSHTLPDWGFATRGDAYIPKIAANEAGDVAFEGRGNAVIATRAAVLPELPAWIMLACAAGLVITIKRRQRRMLPPAD